MVRIASLLLLFATAFPSVAGEANTLRKAAEGQIGARSSAPLVYLPGQKAFALLGGYISHEPKGPFPFDLLTFDATSATWKNWFSEGTADRGKESGPVRDPEVMHVRGYALWELDGDFGVLNSGRPDVAYEDWHGHKLDRALLDALQCG